MKSRIILAGATLVLTSAVAVAQTAAKPSPYQGTSLPPTTDVIRATDTPAAAPAAPPVEQDTPAPAPVQKPVAPAASRPAPVENPDYGIVETPVTTEPGAPEKAPNLQDRPADLDADIVTSVPAPNNQLLAGTAIHARMEQQISSRENGTGTRFSAQVVRDVTQNGRVIIPSGSVVHGKVIHADYGRRISGAATLRLLADEVVLPDGTRYTMTAVPSQTGRSTNTKVNGEGTISDKDRPRRIAGEYALGGGGGAATGAVFGGPTGAVVGASVGAGLVTAHLLLQEHAAILPAGSSITFGLTQPMRLTPLTTTASN